MSKSDRLDSRREIAAPSPAIASLPMYDLPQLRPATEAFWHAIAMRLQSAGLKSVPASLTRSEDYQGTWRDPSLLLGQSCGYPLITQFKDAVKIVATPIYRSPGCQGFEHISLFIVNAASGFRTLEDLRGGVCAINGFDSNTGMNLLRAAIAPLAKTGRFFRSVIVTGSHYRSLEAIADSHADIAAIDCVSFAHFQRFEPELTARAIIVGQSRSTAAPPYITAKTTDAAKLGLLREVFNDVAVAPDLQSVRSALDIEGFAFETETAYEPLRLMEEDAIALGYPELR